MGDRLHEVHVWDVRHLRSQASTASSSRLPQARPQTQDMGGKVTLSPDGWSFRTAMATGRVFTCPAPKPVVDDPEWFARWVETFGGMRRQGDELILLGAEPWKLAAAERPAVRTQFLHHCVPIDGVPILAASGAGSLSRSRGRRAGSGSGPWRL
jgi:hypothetical protein